VIEFNPPSLDRLHDVPDVQDTFRSLFAALDEALQKANDPDFIIVDQRKLSDKVSSGTAWPGVIWAFDGTLASARGYAARYGWAVCDGTQGTPDLRHTFIRGAGANEDAGEVGIGIAAIVHTHTASVEYNQGKDIPLLCGPSGNDTCHKHTATIASGGPVAFYEVLWLRKMS
jgi:hypothetical protein